ncbi:glucose-6-phosphate dehydrogenase assembly protein OpcA [Pseudonocardia humida]|uniref:Glucose-6-phosphate dehydrogenase assembly protein OpcA n=1 Tax=Pseudonocardia humida TaxID=2800819 RepID=A0ABT1A714_9PSEU|nr:glucose-6-phosphate dehydrogenase assembly protein OpcA [Pseudonocardia humida]MCO1658813.1 glucose-6-phosphate dehydrogenase assembly protein OpcA [Pseudonocardia humida]
MIVDLPSTNISKVNKKLVQLRESGGVLALGRVLTLVIITDDGATTEDAIDAANEASREHPCRVIVLARGYREAAPRLDAQIRVGGDAGASEVIVLRGYGALADNGAAAGMVMPLLLPDAPVVAWWPGDAPDVPAEDEVGRLAQRRITDALACADPVAALAQRRVGHRAGDTDLAWSRLTFWRALLATAMDAPPFEPITHVTVVGERVSPSADLLAGWLAARLDAAVERRPATTGKGMVSVRLERASGPIELVRPDGRVGRLSQPGQPDRLVALARREVRDCLAEELRRLDPDEIYGAALAGIGRVADLDAPVSAPTLATSS